MFKVLSLINNFLIIPNLLVFKVQAGYEIGLIQQQIWHSKRPLMILAFKFTHPIVVNNYFYLSKQ